MGQAAEANAHHVVIRSGSYSQNWWQTKEDTYSAYAYKGKGVNQQVHNTYECIYMLSNSNSETIGRDCLFTFAKQRTEVVLTCR